MKDQKTLSLEEIQKLVDKNAEPFYEESPFGETHTIKFESFCKALYDALPSKGMKTIKCDLFLIVGYPHSPTCEAKIEVPEDFKEACEVMNKAGWKKCGGINGNIPGFGYFCPEHAKGNQFYKEPSR